MNRYKELLGYLVLITLILLGGLEVFYLKIQYIGQFITGPKAVPLICISLMLMILVVLSLNTIIKIGKDKLTFKVGNIVKTDKKAVRSCIILMVLILLYIFIGIPLIGLLKASFVFMVVSIAYFSDLVWKKNLAVSAVIAGVFYGIFNMFLHIPM